jgi:hypothetical protein
VEASNRFNDHCLGIAKKAKIVMEVLRRFATFAHPQKEEWLPETRIESKVMV